MLKVIKINVSEQKPWKILPITLIIIISVLSSGCVEKAHEERVYRVGVLSGFDTLAGIADSFKAEMTELDYIEGKNIIYDTHKTNVNLTTDQQIINKFVADKVDLIFIAPTETILLAREITQGKNIPLVFANVVLEGNDLVESVRQPGGNITGVRYPVMENTVKRLEILHELAPQAKRIYLIYDPNYPNARAALEQLRLAALSLGITLVEEPVNNLEELRTKLESRSAFSDIAIDAILLMPDILNASPDGF